MGWWGGGGGGGELLCFIKAKFTQTVCLNGEHLTASRRVFVDGPIFASARVATPSLLTNHWRIFARGHSTAFTTYPKTARRYPNGSGTLSHGKDRKVLGLCRTVKTGKCWDFVAR